jgi:Ca2+-binding EF-hand superfamily protein
MKSQYVWSLIGLIALGSALWAEEGMEKQKKEKKPKATPGEKFAKMDQDQDGALSEAEFHGDRLEKMRQKLEGKEGGADKLAKMEKDMTSKFAKMDKDGDGAISLEEYTAKSGPKERKPKKEKVEQDPADKPDDAGMEGDW